MIETLFHVEQPRAGRRAMPGRPTDAERRCERPAVELYLGDGGAGVLRPVAYVEDAPLVESGASLPAAQYNANVLHVQCDRDRNHPGDCGVLLLLRGNVDDRLYALDVTWREVHR